MADHKTMIGGTTYKVGGGKCLVGGSTYSIKEGKTLIGGSTNNIKFKEEIKAIEPGKVNLSFTTRATHVVRATTGNSATWVDQGFTNLPLLPLRVTNNIVYLPATTSYAATAPGVGGGMASLTPYAFIGPIDTTKTPHVTLIAAMVSSVSNPYATIGTRTTIPALNSSAATTGNMGIQTPDNNTSYGLTTTLQTFEYTCSGTGIGTSVYICIGSTTSVAYCSELIIHS